MEDMERRIKLKEDFNKAIYYMNDKQLQLVQYMIDDVTRRLKVTKCMKGSQDRQ